MVWKKNDRSISEEDDSAAPVDTNCSVDMVSPLCSPAVDTQLSEASLFHRISSAAQSLGFSGPADESKPRIQPKHIFLTGKENNEKVFSKPEECDFELDCTPLLSKIEEQEWDEISHFLRTGYWPGSFLPDFVAPAKQTSTWVTYFNPQDSEVQWSTLPLHRAISGGAPIELIQGLIDVYPRSVFCLNHQGMLPLHVAMQGCSGDRVVDFLVSAFPEGVNIKDKSDQTPIDYAIRSPTGVSGRILGSLVGKSKKNPAVRVVMEEIHAGNEMDTRTTLERVASDASVRSMGATSGSTVNNHMVKIATMMDTLGKDKGAADLARMRSTLNSLDNMKSIIEREMQDKFEVLNVTSDEEVSDSEDESGEGGEPNKSSAGKNQLQTVPEEQELHKGDSNEMTINHAKNENMEINKSIDDLDMFQSSSFEAIGRLQSELACLLQRVPGTEGSNDSCDNQSVDVEHEEERNETSEGDKSVPREKVALAKAKEALEVFSKTLQELSGDVAATREAVGHAQEIVQRAEKAADNAKRSWIREKDALRSFTADTPLEIIKPQKARVAVTHESFNQAAESLANAQKAYAEALEHLKEREDAYSKAAKTKEAAQKHLVKADKRYHEYVQKMNQRERKDAEVQKKVEEQARKKALIEEKKAAKLRKKKENTLRKRKQRESVAAAKHAKQAAKRTAIIWAQQLKQYQKTVETLEDKKRGLIIAEADDDKLDEIEKNLVGARTDLESHKSKATGIAEEAGHLGWMNSISFME